MRRDLGVLGLMLLAVCVGIFTDCSADESAGGPLVLSSGLIPVDVHALGSSGDGKQGIYSVVLAGAAAGNNLEVPFRFYGILTGRIPSPYSLNVPPENIRVLGYGNVPVGYEDVSHGTLTRSNLEAALTWLSTVPDADDLVILFYNGHGNGYLGNNPKLPRNIALHGYISQPVVFPNGSDPDEIEFMEWGGGFEWSINIAYESLYDGRDLHFGMNQWGVSWYLNATLYRQMVVSSFVDRQIRDRGLISDDDVYLERLTNYCRGDLNHNGQIDAGEDFDFDRDGIPAWDRVSGVFDEDDWEDVCDLRDNWNDPHSQLGGIPFQLFDAELDGCMDVDLYPVGVLEVDATDENNNGLFDEGIDINDDGDRDDRFGSNETISLIDGIITDNEMATLWQKILCTKIFLTGSCYGTGFCADLAGVGSIVVGMEYPDAETGDLQLDLLNVALLDADTDVDGDGLVTAAEWFVAATKRDGRGLVANPFVEDDGDAIPREVSLLEPADWGISLSTIIAKIGSTNIAPVVSAGSDQIVEFSAQATLNGTVHDDGLPDIPGVISSNWTVINGPGGVSFVDASAMKTDVVFSLAGVYTLRLTVSDGELSSFDDLVVDVRDHGVNGLRPQIEATSITLYGTVSEGAISVMVDGKPAEIHADSTFSIALPLPVIITEFPVLVTDAEGNLVSRVITIKPQSVEAD